uniref:DUF3575 domain-containing protein n=1 Tax=Alistipes sp. TaxID=1872444 RepID=UPI004055FF81
MITAQDSEAKSPRKCSPFAHYEQASYDQVINLQNITIRYENDKAWPRWSYANNREAYSELVKAVKRLASSQSNVRTVVIEGAASPVGGESYNHNLALRRAKVLRNIIAKLEGGDKLRIHVISAGEDWDTFHSYIESMYHEPNREQVLAILRSSATNDRKERALQALDRGITWRMLVNDFMASARNAVVVHIVEVADLTPNPPSFELAGVAPIKIDIPPVPVLYDTTRVQVAPPRKPVVALRSNLLVPALNIGIEVPISTNWSIGADYYYPWVWPKRDNKNCFELLAWGIEGRYWFGRNRTVFDRLQGHSLGLYGYMGYYDFERNYHGHQGEFINVGVDYTYAMAVGKRKQVHFEFSLGVGYIYSQAKKYTVIESHGPLISDKITKKVGFFGPTKANISLVVPIFQKVKPNDKQRGNE